MLQIKPLCCLTIVAWLDFIKHERTANIWNEKFDRCYRGFASFKCVKLYKPSKARYIHQKARQLRERERVCNRETCQWPLVSEVVFFQYHPWTTMDTKTVAPQPIGSFSLALFLYFEFHSILMGAILKFKVWGLRSLFWVSLLSFEVDFF